MNYEEYELPHISGLPLTSYGAGKLAAFEPADLSYAAEKVLKRGEAITATTYGKFYNIAKSHCLKEGRKENWVRMFKVLKAQGFDGFKEDEPTLIGIGVRLTEKMPVQKERPSFDSFLECHSTCRQLKRGQRCSQTTGMTDYYRSTAGLHPEGSIVSDDTNVQMAAVRIIENYKTEYGKRALKIFGWANPWFDECTQIEQDQLITAYPWITEYIGKRPENPMLQNLSKKMTQTWNKPLEPVTINPTFADGQPLYQTEEEPDDIYNPGGSNSSSQTSYL